MAFYKTDLKYAIRCPLDENHGQKYCQEDVRGVRGQITWLLLKFTCWNVAAAPQNRRNMFLI